MSSLLLFNACFKCSNTDWSPIINAIPGLCWGIIGIFALFFILKYVVKPIIANCHELNVKSKKYEQEEQWDSRKNQERETEYTKSMVGQIDELNSKLKIEKAANELLEKRLSIYEKTFEKLNVEIKPKEKK